MRAMHATCHLSARLPAASQHISIDQIDRVSGFLFLSSVSLQQSIAASSKDD